MDRTKKVLITLLVVGALATVGVGTYATFNAQTTNQGNTFTTGTLVLSDKNGATICYSAGAASGAIQNNNSTSAGCAAVAFAALAKPGDSAAATFTLKNEGSLNAGSGLSLQEANCANSNSGTWFGNGDLCGDLQVSVFDGTNCLYPAGAGACASTAALTSLSTAQQLYSSYAAGTSKNVTITVSMPNGAAGADNQYQGRTATFDLVWTLSQ